MHTITIQDSTVRAVSPEGQTAAMELPDLLDRIAPSRMDTGECVLPDGVKAVRSRGGCTIWVHQTPPRVYQFRWIARDSPARFGRGTEYRTVTIGLPYLVVLAVFGAERLRPWQLSGFNECFFRNEPLRCLDDGLCYPALLNCSRFDPPDGRPLSWICTQHLNFAPILAERDSNRCMWRGLRELMHCLLETGFNYSSEHHESSSWFSESRSLDPRIDTVEAWEKATAQDPLFVLEIPWIPAGHTVRLATERIFERFAAGRPPVRTAVDVARLVFNRRKPK